MRQLRPYLGASGALLAAVVFSSLFISVFEGVGVGLLVPLLSLLLGGEQATPMRPIQFLQQHFPGHTSAMYVGLCCIAIVAAITAKNVASYVAQIFAARLKQRVAVSLRDALFSHLQSAQLEVFEQRSGGEIANVFLVETYRTTVAIDATVGAIQRGGIALVYVAALFYISWPLTLMVIVLAAVVGSSLSFVYGRLSRAGARLTELNHQFASALEQSFAGVKVVRAANAQAREVRRFHDLNLAQAEAEQVSARTTAMLFPLTETVAVFGAMVIVVCAYVLLVRPGHMLSSYLLGYGFVLLRLLPLLNQLYGIQGHLFYLAGGIKEIEKWLSTPVYPQRPFGQAEFEGVRSTLAFEHVGFIYDNGTVALEDVSFDVPAGHTVALVGSSGSGKSTLAALLLRLRAPTSGRITVDGHDYWDFTPASWHQSIATVEQDAFLFHGTLRENILYAREDADAGHLPRAVTMANLDDVVGALPEGIDSRVGERGSMLSGGQRQRVAIARAIARDPSILILDEATSHLDNISEQLVQRALLNAARGRTTLVIAHRLSTVREADWIVVFDQGRVIEQGTWDDLRARGGAFDRLLLGAGIR